MNQLYIQLNILSTKFQSYKKKIKMDIYSSLKCILPICLINFKCTVILDLKNIRSGICTLVADRCVTTLGTHDVIASAHHRSTVPWG